ncbi:hypothetical protein EDC94DRAFT_22747 [Helicostylum pulchrum]|nr:hypothetical protein EDC94DRAFT_22747 [Helicostylum pulchrum]
MPAAALPEELQRAGRCKRLVFKYAENLNSITIDDHRECSLSFALPLLQSIDKSKYVTFIVPLKLATKFNFIVEEERMYNITTKSEDEKLGNITIHSSSTNNQLFNHEGYVIWYNDFTSNSMMNKTDMKPIEASTIINKVLYTIVDKGSDAKKINSF